MEDSQATIFASLKHKVVAAASQLLTPQQTSALKNAGMQRVFAALRAPVHVNFQFKDYITKLLGADPGRLQKMSSNPKLNAQIFQLLKSHTILLNCGSKNLEFAVSWQSALQQLHARQVHLGRLDTCSCSPMVLRYMPAMSEQRNRNYFSLWIVSSVNTPWLQLWQPLWTALGFNLVHFLCGGHSCWKIRGGHYDPDFVIEQRDCQWIMNIGTWHTQTQGCPTCQLCKVGHLAECPWHRGPGLIEDSTSLRVAHMICEKDDNNSVVYLRGVLDHLPEGENFWLFHVCTQQPANFEIGQAMSSFPLEPIEIGSTFAMQHTNDNVP